MVNVGPYEYSKEEIVNALAKIGYTRCGESIPCDSTRDISPEDLITCLVFSRDYRWIMAIAVVICKTSIDWDYMVRLAIAYHFPGTLLGLINAVRNTGRDVGGPALRRLELYESIAPDDITKVLETYGC